MSDDRAFERAVDDWLADGSDRTPAPAVDAVLLAIRTTPQERDLRIPWRTQEMPFLLRAAAVIAIIAVAGLAAFNALGLRPDVGSQPTPSPTTQPAPTQSPTPKPILGSTSKLDPGRYRFTFIPPGATAPFPMSITLPAGWSGFGFGINKNYGPLDADVGAALGLWEITNRFVDPCTDHTLLDPTPGPGIDELIDALASQPGIDAGPPTDVTVDGYRGKFIELTVTADVDTCGFEGFWLWASSDGDRRFHQGANEMNRIYILDVGGVRRTFFARIPARTTAADRAELDAIIDSIDIEQ
jgi:hypothetical protein